MSSTQSQAIDDANEHEQSVQPLHMLFVFVCILAALADGFDLLSLSFAAPLIVREWSVTPALLGTVFSASLVGAVLGALATERLARVFARPTLISLCLAMIGIGTFVTTQVTGTNQLLVVRFLTGIFLGAMMPILLATTAQYLPARVKGRCTAYVIGGIPLGGFLAGMLSATYVTEYGWRILFYIGAVFPFLLIPVAYLVVGRVVALSQSGAASETTSPGQAQPSAASYLDVFRGEYARWSVLVLTAIFAATLLAYFLSQWVPLLLTDSGASQERASTQGALLNLGAVIAVYIFGYILDRFGVLRISFVGYAIAIPCVILLGYANNLGPWSGFVLVATGFFGIGLKVGGTVVVAKYWPPHMQIATVSLGYISTRAGAIMGPLVAGFLLSAEVSVTGLFYIMTLPALAGCLCMRALLGKFERDPQNLVNQATES